MYVKKLLFFWWARLIICFCFCWGVIYNLWLENSEVVGICEVRYLWNKENLKKIQETVGFPESAEKSKNDSKVHKVGFLDITQIFFVLVIYEK